MLSCCRAWPVKACIEMGTSCMLCERRCAVTVISSRASLAPSAVAARDLEADTAPRTAAIAMESLEFIGHPPCYANCRRRGLYFTRLIVDADRAQVTSRLADGNRQLVPGVAA